MVGSFVVGITVRLPRLPVLGETLPADRFDLGPGGKGCNMATAAARQGMDVAIIATVGDDDFADMAFERLGREEVDTRGLRRVPGETTAVGLVYLLPDGQNTIGAYPGAHRSLGRDDVIANADRLKAADVLLVEFSATDEAIAEAVYIASAEGIPVIMDPAPARPIAPSVLAAVDYLTPNETEAKILLGLSPDDRSQDPADLAERLRSTGPRVVILTRGSDGCVVCGPSGVEEMPRYPVEAIDTVGAGDAFDGGLATALARGATIPEALRWATVTAALSTTSLGAVDGLPDRSQVAAALESWDV